MLKNEKAPQWRSMFKNVGKLQGSRRAIYFRNKGNMRTPWDTHYKEESTPKLRSCQTLYVITTNE